MDVFYVIYLSIVFLYIFTATVCVFGSVLCVRSCGLRFTPFFRQTLRHLLYCFSTFLGFSLGKAVVTFLSKLCFLTLTLYYLVRGSHAKHLGFRCISLLSMALISDGNAMLVRAGWLKPFLCLQNTWC